jgi:hypothetical protein
MDVTLLTTPELIRLWREKWQGSQRKFCTLYSLNEGNFSRFLHGKKSSFAAVQAIQKFLSGNSAEVQSPAPKSEEFNL